MLTPSFIRANNTSAKKNKQTSEENTITSALKHAEMREDTAIQRQVKDLEAAGLNPILASGYTGSSSAAATKYVDSEATLSNAKANELNAIANIIGTLFNLTSLTSSKKTYSKT